ncbi:MAG: Arc family DNA-binding protein [Kiritimatiellia bacterium]|nr:Arc family DNA-binding protein [Kiritimatiellia bacterium]
MSTITLKDVPTSVHRTLKSRARQNGRSLNREIIMTLESTLHGTRLDAVAIGEQARTVREAMDVYLTQKDLTALKTAGRR